MCVCHVFLLLGRDLESHVTLQQYNGIIYGFVFVCFRSYLCLGLKATLLSPADDRNARILWYLLIYVLFVSTHIITADTRHRRRLYLTRQTISSNPIQHFSKLNSSIRPGNIRKQYYSKINTSYHHM